MPNYNQDVITINDGDVVFIDDRDKILGMKSDGSAFVVLRYSHSR